MDIIRSEINKIGIPCDSISLLQDKDGVTVARIKSGVYSYVIKCFQSEEFRREISNYHILSSLDIPTIRVIAATDSALLLEDMASSPVYRLARERDMNDPIVAKDIARWYRQLHQQGYKYVALHGANLYDETDFFTMENINKVKAKTRTQKAAAWRMVEENFDTICEMLRRMRRTLTYNDFYYTNMVVARNLSSALMFDYNLLGKGYVYSDLRNVFSSLSPQTRAAFLSEYGTFDPLEEAVDDVVSPIVTLHIACQRKQFPNWATNLIDDINTTFCAKIQRLIDLT